MRRTAKYFLIAVIFTMSELPAQQNIDFELIRSFSSPSSGPKLKGYIGSIYFNRSKSLSFIVSSGLSEGEQSLVYLRDYKNSEVVYQSIEDFKIIPLILGANFRLTKARNLEPFVETELGFNLLRFDLSENGMKERDYEVHFGVGAGCGVNYFITKYLQLVVKLKFNIASKIGGGALFDRRTRYVSFLTGIKTDI